MLSQGRSRRISVSHVHTRSAAECCGLRCLLEPLLRFRLTRVTRRDEFSDVGNKRRLLLLLGPRRSKKQRGSRIHGFLLEVYEGSPSRHSTVLARASNAPETRRQSCCGACWHFLQETKKQELSMACRSIRELSSLVPATPASMKMPPQTDEDCDAIEIGFARVERGFSHDDNMGFIKLIAHDGVIEEEGVSRLLAFIDEFVCSSRASAGFSIMYDLRDLQTPSMGLVTRIANWGNEPARKELWDRLNKACRVVMLPGWRFTICKGALSTFFYMCPPSCRTFLMTAPDEDEASAIVFEPPTANETSESAPLALACRSVPSGDLPREPDAGQFVSARDPEEFKLERGEIWDLGFASFRYGFLPDTGVGFAELRVREQPDEEGFLRTFVLLDKFLDLCSPEQGFRFLLDVRDLNLPSLLWLSRLTEWCSHPSRAMAWKHMNRSYEIVISSGLLFPIWSGLVTLFLTISPPISRTLLLTSPHGSHDGAVGVFGPKSDLTELVQAPSTAPRRPKSSYQEPKDVSWEHYIPGVAQLADILSREFALIPIGADCHMTTMGQDAHRAYP